MQLSSTPFLVAAEIGFVFLLAWHHMQKTRRRAEFKALTLYLTWIAAYAVFTSVLGAKGLYIHEDVLALYPGFWLQLVTVAVCVAPVILFNSVRRGLREIVDFTPLHWFAWFHAIRITALGTAYKTYIGEFPIYFELLVGVPDLLYGFSALWVGWKMKRGRLSRPGFMVWNLVGVLIIVPSAPILLQLGLPGPLQVFDAQPDARVVYTYPMSIAPMIGVPLFALINLWVTWRLWERR